MGPASPYRPQHLPKHVMKVRTFTLSRARPDSARAPTACWSVARRQRSAVGRQPGACKGGRQTAPGANGHPPQTLRTISGQTRMPEMNPTTPARTRRPSADPGSKG